MAIFIISAADPRMGAFNAAATPGPLTGRYNQSGQYSPSSVAYPGWN